MTTSLNNLVSELPEIYQTIYGHPEWDDKVSRDCNERLVLLTQQYDKLSEKLGRPLRVLDLGCAQGFFSLNLASRGASVQGIDFQQENIDVCNALSEENPELDAKFHVGRIEDIITNLDEDNYDLAIGLSVFHHIIHLHGIDAVKQLLSRLADCVQAVILEIAVKEEPLYWAVSQPDDPRELIEQCAFYRLIGQFDTHLSPVPRPMYLISNKRVMFENYDQLFSNWRDYPYNGAKLAHKNSRRYYFGDDFVCKYFNYTSYDNSLTEEESKRNRDELNNEANFLKNPPHGFKTPALLAHGDDKNVGWLVMEKLPGELLSDLLKNGTSINAEKVLKTLLAELVKLEDQGLYHDDVRAWNVMVDNEDNARLIDFGSIVNIPRDCSWPSNLILSFFIFVNELIDTNKNWKGYWRSGQINPFNLPHPWSSWLGKLWQEPIQNWSFNLVQQLFELKEELPLFEASQTAVDQWISSYETVLLETQTRLFIESEHNIGISSQVENLYSELKQIRTELEELPKEIPVDTSGKDLFFENEVQLKWLSENIGNLDILISKYNSDELEKIANIEKAAEAAVNEELSLKSEVESLREQLSSAHSEIQHFIGQNNHLRHELDKVHNSRSWKLTKGYRYIGLQFYLLQQYGLKQRIKHLVKRFLRGIIHFLRKNPALKNRVLNLLNKLGIYNVSYRLYRKVNPVKIEQSQHEISAESHIEQQIINPELLPPAVKEIYLKIKNK